MLVANGMARCRNMAAQQPGAKMFVHIRPLSRAARIDPSQNWVRLAGSAERPKNAPGWPPISSVMLTPIGTHGASNDESNPTAQAMCAFSCKWQVAPK